MSASASVMTSFELKMRMKRSQTYASTDVVAVMAYTLSSLTCFVPSVIATTHTAVITSRLNAADPTIVDLPTRTGVVKPRVSSGSGLGGRTEGRSPQLAWPWGDSCTRARTVQGLQRRSCQGRSP